MTKKTYLISVLSSFLMTIVANRVNECYCSTDCANPYCETTVGPFAWFVIFENRGIFGFAQLFTVQFIITSIVVVLIAAIISKIIKSRSARRKSA